MPPPRLASPLTFVQARFKQLFPRMASKLTSTGRLEPDRTESGSSRVDACT
jgi:hypothetical protein